MQKTLFPLLALLTGCGSLIGNRQEVELGRGVRDQIAEEYKLAARGDLVSRWAVELLRPLEVASATFRDPLEIEGYEVRVIVDDELVNAFAAPGGFTYLSTGLVLQATSCAEIAGVMGHELAHVTERHSVKRVEGAFAAEKIATFFLEEGLARNAALAVWGLLQSTAFSREDESEADLVGLQISYGAGYDPHGLADFFQKLLDKERGPSLEFLSSHPANAKRVATVTGEIQQRYGDEAKSKARGCRGTREKLADVQAHIRNGNVEVDRATGVKKKKK